MTRRRLLWFVGFKAVEFGYIRWLVKRIIVVSSILLNKPWYRFTADKMLAFTVLCVGLFILLIKKYGTM